MEFTWLRQQIHVRMELSLQILGVFRKGLRTSRQENVVLRIHLSVTLPEGVSCLRKSLWARVTSSRTSVRCTLSFFLGLHYTMECDILDTLEQLG